MKRSNFSSYKKIIWLFLVGFIFMMAIAAVIAENIYYNSLPVVTTAFSTQDQLRASYYINGSIAYEKENHKYYAPAALGEVEFLVDNGEAVTENDALYQFSKEKILLCQKELQLSVLQLEEANKSLKTGEKAILQSEINQLRIAELEEQIKELEELYEQDGFVKAEQDGIFFRSVSNKAIAYKEMELAAIVSDTKQAYISWQMPIETGAFFSVGDTINSSVTINETEGEEVYKRNVSCQLQITDLEKSAQFYTFSAKIEEDLPISMEEGASTTVVCNYISRESYHYVIPLSAVTFDENGTTGTVYTVDTRKRVYGDEYYVSAYPVEVIYRAGNFAAVRNLNESDQIAVSSSMPLRDDMAVRID